ncbi:trypsin-like peptidase domain-containing protein [candidate division KSB1 bacterium]|nr:trypsin-like peptidase domain-containing protein [candidate division KSB1 bacterium]
MKALMVLCLIFLPLSLFPLENKTQIINNSRKATVQIKCNSDTFSGSGFFIDDNLVATCLHVVSEFQIRGQQIFLQIFQDITVTTHTGEVISAKCITPPIDENSPQLLNDYAILQLQDNPMNISVLEISELITKDIDVGSDCYFSGYPLSTPALVTHKGMISGIDIKGDIICIQGAINKGNSGGALLSEGGKVIGIISMREGGISLGLQELKEKIESSEKIGSVSFIGVDPLQGIKLTIKTLDRYISTGIGYARSIGPLNKHFKSL